ncbi:unnamed protein product [Penicillium salamii]|uniref:LPXTG-motif cell wall anchor n=1 Tax=Penicillium salamii TaxID=1612424 RepID=A0A9W4N822_9EURO|nr:unnamed protein product [Penicillium salamii]CAG8243050.1 unnamed protein product [Penicillium salamii]CAG8284584.1 unnamed protein product [Penicillium salamii]CAG8286298.1 unnamed protein product [Penicillium salamii]CAG8398530.1 unnamed protein product [Penicillium salamii]
MTSTKPTLVARATDDASTITTLAMSSRFTAPASCSNSWTFEPSGANGISNGLLLQNAHASDNADAACFPSGYSQYERNQPSIVYSPGYCPGGYTSADLVIHDPITTAICCPSDFEYLTILTRGGTFAGCTSMFPKTSSTIVTVRQVSAESTQVSGPITMWAQPIEVHLQESDSSLFVSATTTSNSASPTGTQTSTSGSATPTGGDSGSGDSSSSGLSTGASIGIGVGVGVGALIILAGLGFWFFRRRQAKKSSVSNPPYVSVNPEPSELGGSSQAAASSTPGHTTMSEMDANNGPKPLHELA